AATLRLAVERAGMQVERLWTHEGETDLIGALLWRFAPSRARHTSVLAQAAPPGVVRATPLRRLARKLPYALGTLSAPLSAPLRALADRRGLGAELRCLT